MENILILLHDIDVKMNKSGSDKKRSQFEFIQSLFMSLIEIIAVEESVESNHAKRIMLESFCFNAKRILDQYKVELKDSIYFTELKKVRNILAHDVITYQVNDNGIVFNHFEKGMETIFSKFYSNNEGVISISRFMLYHTRLLTREVYKLLPNENFTGINITEKILVNGLKLLSEYEMQLDNIHDQYVEIISPIYSPPANSIKYLNYHADFVKTCKRALVWLKGKESIFQVDYLNANISLSVFMKDVDDSIMYAKKSEEIIREIEADYPFVTTYLIHIYASLSKSFYNKKNKSQTLLYALKSLKIFNFSKLRLLDRIIFNVNLANAYSLYKSKRECGVLLDCLNMINEAEEDEYKQFSEHKYMVLSNLLESFMSHNKKLPDHCVNLFPSLYESNLSKDTKNEFKKKVIKYHQTIGQFPEAIRLIQELLNKKIVVNNERLSFEIILLYLMHQEGICILSKVESIEKKVEKLSYENLEERHIYEQFKLLKKVI